MHEINGNYLFTLEILALGTYAYLSLQIAFQIIQKTMTHFYSLIKFSNS